MLLLAAGTATVARAQGGGEHRQGFWWQAGVMAAANREDCTNCAAEEWNEGVAITLRAGGTVSRYVLLGGEFYGFRHTDDVAQETKLQGILAIAQWYPWLNLGGFLRTGIGVSNLNLYIMTESGASTRADKTGLALSLGIGWDIRVSERFSITPLFNSYVNGVGDLEVEPAGTADDVLTTLFTAGVAVTFH